MVTRAVLVWRLMPDLRFSVWTSTRTSIEVRPTKTTCPMRVTSSPTSIGSWKSTWSKLAVTHVVPECLAEAAYAQRSIFASSSPPNSFPRKLASLGRMTSAMVTWVSAARTPCIGSEFTGIVNSYLSRIARSYLALEARMRRSRVATLFFMVPLAFEYLSLRGRG